MRRAIALSGALALSSACATSPLIARNDAVFEASLLRLAETSTRANAIASSPEDAALFLQAESFYRYRFTLRLHDARSYLAQTLAAALDFGPFAAAAASNGIADLRLQSYDGAAQLYEAHLARFGESRLAPLSLWRLGWACRAIQSDAFPRGSDAVLKQLAARGDPLLSPLAKSALDVPWKSQRTAVALSIVPGLGQIYAGEPINGSIRIAIAAAFAALFIAPLAVAVKQDNYTWQRLTLSTAGFIGLQVAYTTAYQDAQRAALDFDERQEAAFFAAHPDAP